MDVDCSDTFIMGTARIISLSSPHEENRYQELKLTFILFSTFKKVIAPHTIDKQRGRIGRSKSSHITIAAVINRLSAEKSNSNKTICKLHIFCKINESERLKFPSLRLVWFFVYVSPNSTSIHSIRLNHAITRNFFFRIVQVRRVSEVAPYENGLK